MSFLPPHGTMAIDEALVSDVNVSDVNRFAGDQPGRVAPLRTNGSAQRMKVLVTGAAGFAGRALVRELAAAGHSVRAAVHCAGADVAGADSHWIGDLAEATNLDRALEGVDAVAHLAAMVHRMGPRGSAHFDDYRRINLDATLRVAETAARAGVRRFLFLSSVKANCGADGGTAFTKQCNSAPSDPYGASKWEAEQALRDGAFGNMDVVIIRPPLVYGPQVKANFLALLRVCDFPVPIPLGAARDNRRSMIFLGNLTDVVRHALCSPAAAGRTYLVRDGEDLAPADLIARLRRALGRRPNLISVPKAPIAAIAAMTGRRAAFDRLFGSLCVDDSPVRTELGWRPPYTVTQGLVATASWYRARCRNHPSFM